MKIIVRRATRSIVSVQNEPELAWEEIKEELEGRELDDGIYELEIISD